MANNTVKLAVEEATKKTTAGDGRIVRIIGPVVDVKFDGAVPPIYNALTVEAETPIGHLSTILEVESQLPGGVVRTVAMSSTDGLQRGLIDGKACLGGNLTGQVKREAEGIVQLERLDTGQDLLMGLLQAAHHAGQDVQTGVDGAAEAQLLGADDLLDIRFMLAQLGAVSYTHLTLPTKLEV